MSTEFVESISERELELPFGVSIILFTFNSHYLVQETIQHLLDLPHKNVPVEILVLDNNSKDNTIEIAESILSEANWPYRIIKQDKPGLLYSRIAGISAAKYRYFIFVDDDNRLRGDWISSVSTLLSKNPDVALLGGVNEARFDGAVPRWWEPQQNAFAVGRANRENGTVQGTYAALWGAGLAGRTYLVRTLYQRAPFWLTGRTGNKLLAGDDSELTYWVRILGFTLYQSDLNLQHVILARKLTDEYLFGIHEGFRYSDHFMLQYRISLTSKSWAAQMVKYSIWQFLKWLLAPIRKSMASNELQRIDIQTKSPAFAEVVFFWKRWKYWRSVFNEIQSVKGELFSES